MVNTSASLLTVFILKRSAVSSLFRMVKELIGTVVNSLADVNVDDVVAAMVPDAVPVVV